MPKPKKATDDDVAPMDFAKASHSMKGSFKVSDHKASEKQMKHNTHLRGAQVLHRAGMPRSKQVNENHVAPKVIARAPNSLKPPHRDPTGKRSHNHIHLRVQAQNHTERLLHREDRRKTIARLHRDLSHPVRPEQMRWGWRESSIFDGMLAALLLTVFLALFSLRRRGLA